MNKIILIVEDEVKLAQLMSDYLQQSGFTTRCIGNGTEAVSAAQKTSFDLILLDLMLPGLDGMEVCKSLRRFSDVPIIMVTARVDEIDRLLGLEITEINPILDDRNRTAELAVDLILSGLGKRIV